MAIQPIIVTPNLKSVQAFYEQVLGATEVFRYPEVGDVFYKTLKIGDAELGLVAEEADVSAPPRITLSIDVADVTRCCRWSRLLAGGCWDRPTTCRGGNASRTCSIRTETP